MANQKIQPVHLDKQSEWKRLYESGMSFSGIGKMNGVFHETVQRVLKGCIEPRTLLKYENLSEKWVDLYVNEGFSTVDIATIYKTNAKTVSRYLKKEGVTLRRTGRSSPHVELFHLWVSEYESGKSLKEIADAYGVSSKTVLHHIKEKVKMRTRTESCQVYGFEHPAYFDVIDCQEKAYWLGIWYGMGCAYKSMGHYQSILLAKEEDRIILERFKNRIGYEKPIEEGEGKASTLLRLNVSNRVFYENLVKQGLGGNKIRTLQKPTHMPDELYNSFILGLYEGKGSCALSDFTRKGIEHREITFQLYGNREFLTSVKEIIFERTGVELCICKKHEDENSPTFILQSSSKKNIKHIADWLYSGGSPYTEHRDIRALLRQV